MKGINAQRELVNFILGKSLRPFQRLPRAHLIVNPSLLAGCNVSRPRTKIVVLASSSYRLHE